MVVPFEQSVVNWLLIGGMVAVLYSLRYLVVLERRVMGVEESVQQVLRRLEMDEREVLMREKAIENALVKKRKK